MLTSECGYNWLVVKILSKNLPCDFELQLCVIVNIQWPLVSNKRYYTRNPTVLAINFCKIVAWCRQTGQINLPVNLSRLVQFQHGDIMSKASGFCVIFMGNNSRDGEILFRANGTWTVVSSKPANLEEKKRQKSFSGLHLLRDYRTSPDYNMKQAWIQTTYDFDFVYYCKETLSNVRCALYVWFAYL